MLLLFLSVSIGVCPSVLSMLAPLLLLSDAAKWEPFSLFAFAFALALTAAWRLALAVLLPAFVMLSADVCIGLLDFSSRGLTFFPKKFEKCVDSCSMSGKDWSNWNDLKTAETGFVVAG